MSKIDTLAARWPQGKGPPAPGMEVRETRQPGQGGEPGGRAGPAPGSMRGSPEEVIFCRATVPVDTSRGPHQTLVLGPLSGGPNRKTKTDAWTEGAPANTSEEPGQGGDGKGGNSRGHKSRPTSRQTPAPGTLLFREACLCRFCKKPPLAGCLRPSRGGNSARPLLTRGRQEHSEGLHGPPCTRASPRHLT